MDSHSYHHYLLLGLDQAFYQLPRPVQQAAKASFARLVRQTPDMIVTAYLARGFKPNVDMLLWCRSQDPAHVSVFLGQLKRTELGRWLQLRHTYFGIVRPSNYSGRTGKPEQVMQNYDERLPYFVLYPFTKTHEWHQLDLDRRKTMMYEHMNLGVTFPQIRQCLLYSYGVDDQEFVVSYEMSRLEDFQDLVIKLRATAGRAYTHRDTPIFTALYYPLAELLEKL